MESGKTAEPRAMEGDSGEIRETEIKSRCQTIKRTSEQRASHANSNERAMFS